MRKARDKRAKDMRYAGKDKKAMDAAIDAAVRETERRLEARQRAAEAVFPHVGKVHGLDTAEAIYKFALDSKGVATKDVHPSAFEAMVRMLPRPGSSLPVAMDSTARGNVVDLIPALSRYA